MADAEPYSRWGFRFGSPAPTLHFFLDASRLGWGARLLDRSRVHGVFRTRDGVPHLSSRLEGAVLALSSIPEGITVHVAAMCDDSMVVASVNERGGTVSRFLCSLADRPLRWSECLGLDLRYLPGSPMF